MPGYSRRDGCRIKSGMTDRAELSRLTPPLPQRSIAGMASLPHIANNPDIRFLGALLGDVIRDYGGEDLFAATEAIRRASVDRHRGDGSDEPALASLGLDRLGLDETLDFVRGFMLFSMLANLAEDRQGIATDAHADMASAIATLAERGHRPRAGDGAARPGARRPRPDRAPDRGAAQEHDRPPQPDRATARAEGCRRRRDPRWRPGRRRDPPPDRAFVADPRPAPREIVRQRRGRHRAQLSARCLFADAARALPALGPRDGHAGPQLPAPRQLDRRRPRRQSLRHRGQPAHRARPVERGGARLLSVRAPFAGRGTVDLDRARGGGRGGRGTGRGERRHRGKPAGRTLSPRAVGHLCPASPPRTRR